MKTKIEELEDRIQLHINEIQELLEARVYHLKEFHVKQYARIVAEDEKLIEMLGIFEYQVLQDNYNPVELRDLKKVFFDEKGNCLDIDIPDSFEKIYALTSRAKKYLEWARMNWEQAEVKITAFKNLMTT